MSQTADVIPPEQRVHELSWALRDSAEEVDRLLREKHRMQLELMEHRSFLVWLVYINEEKSVPTIVNRAKVLLETGRHQRS